MARILFGGPNLPEGYKTWYFHRNPDGTDAGQVFVEAGDVVDEERIYRHAADDEDGKRVLAPNADYYVETGRAVRLEE